MGEALGDQEPGPKTQNTNGQPVQPLECQGLGTAQLITPFMAPFSAERNPQQIGREQEQINITSDINLSTTGQVQILGAFI